jgi:hypothetical protein
MPLPDDLVERLGAQGLGERHRMCLNEKLTHR